MLIFTSFSIELHEEIIIGHGSFLGLSYATNKHTASIPTSVKLFNWKFPFQLGHF
jgi:hypothetical protein